MSTITRERLAHIYEENESLALANERLHTELKAAKDRIAELESRDIQPVLQGKAIPDEMTVEAAYPDVQTGWGNAKYYTRGWNACRAAMLNQAPKPEKAND
ncbi:hypothetical protein EN46_06675 [Citrobacter amalonaticus]